MFGLSYPEFYEAIGAVLDRQEHLYRFRKRRRIEREQQQQQASSEPEASSPDEPLEPPEQRQRQDPIIVFAPLPVRARPSFPVGYNFTPSENAIVTSLIDAGIIFFQNGKWLIDLIRFSNIWVNIDIMSHFNSRSIGRERLMAYIRRMLLPRTNGLEREMPAIQRMAHPSAPDVMIDVINFTTFDVRNLRAALLLYFLRRLTQLNESSVSTHQRRFKVLYQTNADSQIGEIYQVAPDEIRIQNGVIEMDDVFRVFGAITGTMYDGRMDVTDDDVMRDTESGEVIQIILGRGGSVNFFLTFRDLMNVPVGAKWSDEMEPMLNSIFQNQAIAGVKNRSDKLCLLYTIVLGYASLKWGTNLFSRKKWMEVDEVNNLWREVTDMDEPGKKLMLSINHRTVGGEMEKLVGDSLTLYSTKEMYQIMRDIEDRYVVKDFGLEAYGTEITEDGKIRCVYPFYVSTRETDKRIKVLNLRCGKLSHYFLITSEKALWRVTGSKIFFTCETCNLTFFTRHGLAKHTHFVDSKHPMNHWSRVCDEDDPSRDCYGVCQKCHLMFALEEDYDYHMKHCFMKHRSGTRYVRLSDELTLKGGDDKMDATELEDKCILFADFECSISNNGKHEFMSYGLYSVSELRYWSGYSMEEFVTKLKLYADQYGTIYVYFHNAMNYDANFLIRHILQKESNMTVSVIMKSINRLQSVKVTWKKPGCKELKKIKIGDTFLFMTMSLERIVNSVRVDDVRKNAKTFENFFRTTDWIYGCGFDAADMILKKNLFPYYFFRSDDALNCPLIRFEKIFRPLPENLQYFSEGVTVEDLEKNYPQFTEICQCFKIQSALQYHDLYLCCDVMQITDVFLNARKTLFETHHIDICDYIGMPSASWHAFLKLSPSLELPLYTSTRYAEFFSSMTRGGVTSAVLRYAKADDSHKILYLDVNGLYPYVMQQYLYPCGDMKWVNFSGDENENPTGYFMTYLKPMMENRHCGMCLCVDLEIPYTLHEKTAQFPFAPEHRLLKADYFDENGDLYPFLAKWSEANGGVKMQSFIGLVGTLFDKKEYGVHWKLLVWYVEHGVIIRRLHYAVMFDEGDYLKDYVRLNIELRNKRSDELGKMVYKLMGNSIYGKTFESPFNHSKYMIIRNREKLQGLLEEGNVEQIVSLDENNSIVKLGATEVVLDKPTYIGACVTEYAKLHMYQLFYDKLMGIFGNGLELVYTDTDSFIIRVKHEPGMSTKEVIAYINSKCPGLIGKLGGQIKSETGEDDSIDEVVALRSKLYAYKTLKGEINKHAKGVTGAAQKLQLSWEDYVQALVTLRSVPTRNVQFQRSAMQIRTVEIVKNSISVNDGKRKIDIDGIHTKPFGYKDVEYEELNDED